jgi:iron complex outermembrane receptor protein
MKYFSLFIFTIYLFMGVMINNSNSAIVSGIVTDAETGESLQGATVRLDSTKYGAIAEKGGKFLIKSIPEGSYFLEISFIGYEIYEQSIKLKQSDSIYLRISLKSQPVRKAEVVISANKRLQAVQDVPISIAVIDKRSLLQRNVYRIDEALLYAPGVSMNGDQVSIRGSSGVAIGVGSRVAYLLDGMPLLSGDNGDMKFDALPVFDIEQVEIVKGAGSALYGSSAIGGVINMITKEPTDQGVFNYRVQGGLYTLPKYQSWRYRSDPSYKNSADIGYSKKIDKTGISLSAGVLDDQSYREFDDSFRWNLYSKVTTELTDNQKLKFLMTYAYDHRADWVYWNSLDSATIPPTGTNLGDKLLSTKFTGMAEYRNIFSNDQFLVIRSGIYKTYLKTSQATTDPDYRESDAYSINSEIQWNNKVFNDFLLTFGANHVFNNVDANVFGKQEQQVISGYAQGELTEIKNTTITLGGRVDEEKTHNQESNFQFSPKAGVSWNSDLGVNFRASVGRGFRTATIAERFTSTRYNGISVIPNPLLKPESSWSYEIGCNSDLDISKSPVHLDLAIFRNEYFDLIEPTVIVEQNAAQFQNITRARIQGLELDIKSMITDFLGLETSLTMIDPRDLNLHETLKYRSKFTWYTRLIVPVSFFEFQADFRYASKMENIDNLLTGFIKDGDARTDMRSLDVRFIVYGSKLFDYPIIISLNASNVLNYYYTVTPGNLGPTRFLSLQVEGSL